MSNPALDYYDAIRFRVSQLYVYLHYYNWNISHYLRMLAQFIRLIVLTRVQSGVHWSQIYKV